MNGRDHLEVRYDKRRVLVSAKLRALQTRFCMGEKPVLHLIVHKAMLPGILRGREPTPRHLCFWPLLHTRLMLSAAVTATSPWDAIRTILALTFEAYN